jgi:arylsulfatase A-like enzyme
MVLVVVDTLRADRLGCYGHDRETTPTIDRLAREGVLFERLHASSPWTAPSFGTLLTGMSPTVHRAGADPRFEAEAGAGDAEQVSVAALTDDLPTLGELLEERRTHAIVTNTFLNPGGGYGRGFDGYDWEQDTPHSIRRADEAVAEAIDWLSGLGDEPFFLLLHLFDPHMNYDPPPAYEHAFAPGPVGRLSAPFTQVEQARSGALDPTAEERAFIEGLYAGEVRFVDDQIGLLVAAMRRMGLLDATWLVVTSDHGEEHFDHGGFEHGHRYEEEVTRVPLVVRAPGGAWRAGTRVAASVAYVDLLPTILDLLDEQAPPHLEGESLVAWMTGRRDEHRPAFMEFNLYGEQRVAVFDGRWKLVMYVDRDEGRLYDLEEDPLETTRLGPDHPRFSALREILARHRLALREAAEATSIRHQELTPDMVEALKMLGYIRGR